MSRIIYKKAQVKDLDNFFKFFSKSIKDYFPEYTEKTKKLFITSDYSKESIQDSLKKEGALYLAKDKEKVVGYLLTTEKPYGGVWFLNWIAVDKNYRNQKIAKNLLNMWEEEALRKGVHCLMLCSDKRNNNFYKKMGFVFMGFVPKGYFGAEDFWFYKLIQEAREKNYFKSL